MAGEKKCLGFRMVLLSTGLHRKRDEAFFSTREDFTNKKVVHHSRFHRMEKKDIELSLAGTTACVIILSVSSPQPLHSMLRLKR